MSGGRGALAVVMVLAAVVATGCRSYRDGEVESARTEVADLRAVIASLQRDLHDVEVHRVANSTAGVLHGIALHLGGHVTEVDGSELTIRIEHNPGRVDIGQLLSDRPFTLAVFDEHGYKADAFAREWHAATGTLRCRLVQARDGAVLRVGDRALIAR